ncbi:3139_t:CDS:2 [Dentiscutata erythropus]|uniref:3139_t:CDS:1 n=1 Tax=Dentiscutata erythropus TaxID=1348616 RepID=A0A9N9JE95_9GLOM|nr:3139_t:CDS:2 [Dentiscutata erythropus]
MDQDYTSLKLECYHPKKLLVDEDAFIVHLHNINFCKYQKPINAKSLTNVPWLSGLNEPPTNESSSEKVTKTIASRVKGGKQRKATTTTRSYILLKDRSKVTDLAKKALNQDKNTDVFDLSTL